MTVREKFEKVKENFKTNQVTQHVKRNQTKYLLGTAAFFAATTTIAIVLLRKQQNINNLHANLDNLTDCNVNVANVMTIENLTQTITKYGNKWGHPGNPVIDLDTGKEFASQTLAAIDAGVSDTSMWKHLDGFYDNLNGRRFARKNDLAWEAFDMLSAWREAA